MKRYLFILIVFAGFLSSCEEKASINDNLLANDDELILAIQNADNKVVISVDELLPDSKKILNSDYSENTLDEAKYAPELGYEVALKKKGGSLLENGGKERNGGRFHVYFDLRGKELRSGKDNGGQGACFSFVFPITYTMPDESEITGSDMKELKKAIKAWYKDNPDTDKKLSLIFPVEVNFKGRTIIINNEREMYKVRMDCAGDKDEYKDKVPCIEMLYPVSYLLPSGRTLTADSGEDLRTKMAAWKEANPDSRERPSLVYPVNVKFKGEEMTIKNKREMFRIRTACAGEKNKDDDGDKEACFDLVYPLTYVISDSRIVAESEKDFDKALKQWYKDHPDSRVHPALQFPIKISYESDRGNRIVDIADQEALKKAYDDCDR